MKDRVIPFAKYFQYGHLNLPSGLSLREEYYANRSWIRRMKREGRWIIDIGNGGTKTSSPFYKMERELVEGYANYIRVKY